MKKKVLLIGGIAVATLFVGGWALAQATGHGGFGPPFMRGMGHGGMGPGIMMRHMGPGMHPGMGFGMMGGTPGFALTDPAQLDKLKKEIGITTAQEPAWTTYAKTVQDAAATMKAAQEGINPETFSKLSPQDRFTSMTKIREQGQKQFETVKTAVNELLATFDETQKIKAQEMLPGLAFSTTRTT